MLQQTQVKTVEPYYHNFITLFPTIKALAQASRDSVLKAWEGLGYYQRARNLHKAAQTVLNEYQGVIPDDFNEIKKLPGIGDYIAAALISIAYHQPFAVVDGNVKRVLARLFCMDQPVNESKHLPEFKNKAQYLLDQKQPGIFNQAVMELGALRCTPKNPECKLCPLNPFCCAYQQIKVDTFPFRKSSNKGPTQYIATGIVSREGNVLITKRSSEGLLGGLWEFPGGKIESGEKARTACQREIREEVGIKVQVTEHLTQIKHAYTHFKIVMEVFKCRYISGNVTLDGPVDYKWIKPDELENYAFPRANHKFFHLLHKNKG